MKISRSSKKSTLSEKSCQLVALDSAHISQKKAAGLKLVIVRRYSRCGDGSHRWRAHLQRKRKNVDTHNAKMRELKRVTTTTTIIWCILSRCILLNVACRCYLSNICCYAAPTFAYRYTPVYTLIIMQLYDYYLAAGTESFRHSPFIRGYLLVCFGRCVTSQHSTCWAPSRTSQSMRY